MKTKLAKILAWEPFAVEKFGFENIPAINF
jgi:hypothetical protein